MTVTKNDDDNDVFRLLEDDAVKAELPLDSASGTEGLRQMFATLLEDLIEGDVSISYLDTPDYSVGMYKEVCKEYVAVLQNEINDAATKIEEAGLRRAK